MGETLYPLHPVRSHEQDQNLTPYSAVSSFNLPHSCDSSLITPVSMTPSSLTVSTTPVLGSDMDIKLSPSNSMSPTYDVFELEEEYGMPKYNPPMKYKHPHGTLHISTTDANFPHSPLVPSTPYWGAYGVSATPVSTTPESPPTMIRSPIGPVLHSTGHLGYDGDQGRLQATSQSYRNRTTVPLLIAPHPRVQSPTSMAESIPTSSTPYRQNSLQSVSTTSSNASAISSRARSKSRIATIPIRRRRKSPKHAQGGEILLSGDMSNDDRVLIQLSEGQRLPWKEIVRQFHERTGKNLKPAALQMRKKRLMDKLRVWTPSDERALRMAYCTEQSKDRWDLIAEAMMNHGCTERWSKEQVEKKWQQLHPEEDDYLEEDFNHDSTNHLQMNNDFGVEDWTSMTSNQGLPMSSGQISAISATTMEDVRSRQASDASSHHMQLQQTHMIFDHQQQEQSAWSHGT